jgi:hypothetical protein
LIDQWIWNADALKSSLSASLDNYKSLQVHSKSFISNHLGDALTPTKYEQDDNYQPYYEQIHRVAHPFGYVFSRLWDVKRPVITPLLIFWSCLLGYDGVMMFGSWPHWREEIITPHSAMVYRILQDEWKEGIELKAEKTFIRCVQQCGEDGDDWCNNIIKECQQFYQSRVKMEDKLQQVETLVTQIEGQCAQLGAQVDYSEDEVQRITANLLHYQRQDIIKFREVDDLMVRVCHCLCLSFESVRDALRDSYITEVIES